jgi:hypothetical protein
MRDDGTVDRVHDRLRDQMCDAQGRDPMPSAGIVDSQSLRGADTVCADQRGYDAGKRVNGTTRHIVTDTLGLGLVVLVTAASVQDRDGGRRVVDRLRLRQPSVALIFADGGYAGRLVAWHNESRGSPSRSCANPKISGASPYCPDAGSWNAHCRG